MFAKDLFVCLFVTDFVDFYRMAYEYGYSQNRVYLLNGNDFITRALRIIFELVGCLAMVFD